MLLLFTYIEHLLKFFRRHRHREPVALDRIAADFCQNFHLTIRLRSFADGSEPETVQHIDHLIQEIDSPLILLAFINEDMIQLDYIQWNICNQVQD